MRINIVIDDKLMKETLRATGMSTPQADKLDALLGSEPVATGDLVLTEVLQGVESERDFNQAKNLLTSMAVVTRSYRTSVFARRCNESG